MKGVIYCQEVRIGQNRIEFIIILLVQRMERAFQCSGLLLVSSFVLPSSGDVTVGSDQCHKVTTNVPPV